jgi:1-acyl-sn-glycerol-3-phosphate acyltransferase
MSAPWDSPNPPVHPPLRPLGGGLIILRAVFLLALVFGGLTLLLLVRMIERPLFGQNRPLTPCITQFVCKAAFFIIGVRRRVIGRPMQHRGAVVANHTSWLDIFTLNAAQHIYFVSKAEVAAWPGIGWLARATGTVFIERNPRRAREQTQVFQERLLHGHRLLFFPEGTSTDGLQILPFKTTLFQAFLTPELYDKIWIQPVTVTYDAPDGADSRFYGWWGDMTFGSHLLTTLSIWRQGRVTTSYHTPLKVANYQNRKDLALACEAQIKTGHETGAVR